MRSVDPQLVFQAQGRVVKTVRRVRAIRRDKQVILRDAQSEVWNDFLVELEADVRGACRRAIRAGRGFGRGNGRKRQLIGGEGVVGLQGGRKETVSRKTMRETGTGSRRGHN